MPQVKHDLISVRNWYENINMDLLNEFKVDLNRQIDYIVKYPEHFQRKYKELRLMSLSKFPYLIYYVLDKENFRIVIFGILHDKRNPELISQRL